MQFQRQILDAIRRIHRAIRESSRAAEAEVGLSGAQLLVLQFLRAGGAFSINELAEKTQTHQSSVSAVVGRLVDSGLVKRSPSRQDARRTEVTLTADGKQRLEKKNALLAQERLFSAIAQLPIAKQRALSELLTEVVDLAGFTDQPASLFYEDSQEEKQ